MKKTRATKFQPAPDHPTRSGFTLVEIMVTLVVMALAAALAAPALLAMAPNMTLKTAARDLYSNMQKARMLAIKENKDAAIIFDTANKQYILCADSGADGVWSTLADNTVVETVSLQNDYEHGIDYGHGNVPANKSATEPPAAFPDDEVSYNSNVVVFNSRGFGGAGYVYLDHRDQDMAYAVGSLSSGSIRVKKWIGTKWD